MGEKWKLELEAYIRQGEPTRSQKSEAWQTAIGLQQVDGLTTSEYLLNTAKEHIEDNINIAQVQNIIKEENNYTIIKNEVRIQNYAIVKTEKE